MARLQSIIFIWQAYVIGANKHKWGDTELFTMLFGIICTTFAAALVGTKQLEFTEFKYVAKQYLTWLTVSGDLSCAVYSTGNIACWNTYETSTGSRSKKSKYLFLTLSVSGIRACGTINTGDVYCTKNIKVNAVEWVLVLDYVVDMSADSFPFSPSVELDGNTVCVVSDSLACGDFITLMGDKEAWKEKKAIRGKEHFKDGISISGKHACLNYYKMKGSFRVFDTALCTYNFNADSPDWKILDAPVSNIKISNGIMCGTGKNNFYLIVCLENGKWVTKSKEVSNFALDSDHVVAFLKNLDLSVAAFP
eukprot:NODE_39_length_29903_cov_0.529057.p8 type:complete len:307 gc:universal NODE_39_length_29903_cov_0.529057:27315-28235(+)